MNLLILVAFLSYSSLAHNIDQIKTGKADVIANTHEPTIDTLKKLNFDSSILIITRKAGKAEVYDALFIIPEFVSIYEDGSRYVNDAIGFLAKTEYSSEEKKICICSMQKLALDEYVRFGYLSKDLYSRNKINEDILNWVINPNFSTRHILVRNYKNKRVIALLKEIQNDKMISSNFRKLITDILSGQLFQEIENSGG